MRRTDRGARDGGLRVREIRRPSEPDPADTGVGSRTDEDPSFRPAHRHRAHRRAGLSGCSLIGGSDQEASDQGSPPDEVVLVTHESFTLPKPLLRDFEEQSGYRLEVRSSGDAGALTTKLAVTRDDPTGDVAFGVDNTFASRALEEDVFDDPRRRPAGRGRRLRPGR